MPASFSTFVNEKNQWHLVTYYFSGLSFFGVVERFSCVYPQVLSGPVADLRRTVGSVVVIHWAVLVGATMSKPRHDGEFYIHPLAPFRR